MTVVVVSFTTRPGEGSEGGVGWEFLKAAAIAGARQDQKVIAIIDQRDASAVNHAVKKSCPEVPLDVRPICVPKVLLRKYGNRRTRQTYLGWAIKAHVELRKILKREQITKIHQVTFATATLPPVFLGLKGPQRIWGPINIPIMPTKIPLISASRTAAIVRAVGVYFSRKCDVVVATNMNTYRMLDRHNQRVHLEPNIVVDYEVPTNIKKDPQKLCMVGNLNNRKQPQIAIEMMHDKRISGYCLDIIGDGPLRQPLEKYVTEEGLSGRVNFLGRLRREETIKRIACSRALVHPSISEGAAWVIGEAASVGVPAVAFRNSGADSTIELSNNGGSVAETETKNPATALADAVASCLNYPSPQPSSRWNSARLPDLIENWWK